ncbi:MAG TPA: anthranilate phosphoribosyltransferase [Actinomycetota bacterium]|nr:anthranilate phosphoribosyltransferase [Actinomycetota bacterium]
MNALWPKLLGRLLAREDLSADETAEAMRGIASGEATPAQVAAFAVGLRAKGETAGELSGLARTLLEMAPTVETPGPVTDTSGSGGDHSKTINVSTIAAIVAAGGGAIVAKQGNRARSSRCGSADLVEALGVKVILEPDAVTRCLEQCGIAFMFAPRFHPSLSQTAIPRREMGVPTVFDYLAPLTNPARPAAQLVGVSDQQMLPVIAAVLAERGTKGYVARGTDGIDEITTTGPTEIFEVNAGTYLRYYVLPIEIGVAVARPADLAGGDAATNAGLARAVLSGEKGPGRDIVCVNAAAALSAAGLADDIEDGLQRAAESIDSGKAAAVLDRWVEVSNRV